MATAKKAAKKTAAKKKAPASLLKRKAGAAAVAGLYAEVSKAAGIEAAAGEALVSYVPKAVDKLSKLPDETFTAMSKGAQEWYDKCVDAINDHGKKGAEELAKHLPELDGFPAAAAAADDSTPQAEARAGKAAKTTKAAKEAKEPTQRVTTPKTDGVAYKMRAQVVADPAVSYEDACKRAKVNEERGGNAWNAFQNAKHVTKIALDSGWKMPKPKE